MAAQFFGHTHKEQFKISYDVEGVEANPINVAFVGGSITTYSNLNPSYRVYTVDGQRQDSTFVSIFPLANHTLTLCPPQPFLPFPFFLPY